MKIVWLCNNAPEEACEAFSIQKQNSGGWMQSSLEMIKQNPNIELTVSFITGMNVPKKCVRVSGVDYWAVARKGKHLWEYSEEQENDFIELLNHVQPDVIHIWGTEYPHTLSCVKAAEKVKMIDRVAISIQGLVSVYALHYLTGLPVKVLKGYTLKEIITQSTLTMQQKHFARRGEYEVSAIKAVHSIIGRTAWDHTCTKQINPKAKYYVNNESLRKEFYCDTWKCEDAERHSVVVSQANYPVKGFHYCVEAVRIVKEFYPDVKVYVCGPNDTYKTGIKASTYGLYILDRIKKYGLQNNIVFLGSQNAGQMKQRMLRGNVFVSPSTIENSPNSVGEAMLLGVPIVSSNVGGVSSMLDNGTEGLLYPSDEAYTLAENIMKVFQSDQYAEELGRAARTHAQKTHSRENNAKVLVEIYSDIVTRIHQGEK